MLRPDALFGGKALEPLGLARRSCTTEARGTMSSNCTISLKTGVLVNLWSVSVVLGGAGFMLGAHHSKGHSVCPSAMCLPTGAVGMAAANSHAGHAGAATLDNWSSARSFRRVSEVAWGRRAALDSAELLAVLKINRIDEKHARGRTLLIPDSIGPELGYSPLPDSLPSLGHIPKFVLVSRRVQAFGAYENGKLVRWGPTSTGKEATPTDSGLFFTNWKSKRAISTDDPSWILDWYVNFIALKGVAFHEYDLPGRPASHGCVRLLEVDARWMFRWADQWVPGRGHAVKEYGTPVLVMGDYDYHAPAPWTRLAEDPGADRVPTEEIEAVLRPHLGIIAARSMSVHLEIALGR
jgi:L,D-transpeptidase catalytic domain